MAQRAITSYFGKRKRVADDILCAAKKIQLDDRRVEVLKANALKFALQGDTKAQNAAQNVSMSEADDCTQTLQASTPPHETESYGSPKSSEPQNNAVQDKTEGSVEEHSKLHLRPENLPQSGEGSKPTKQPLSVHESSPVKFQLKGCLSPKKHNFKFVKENPNNNVADAVKVQPATPVNNVKDDSTHIQNTTGDFIKDINVLVNKIKQSKMKVSSSRGGKPSKQSRSDISNALKKSSRLEELQASVNKLNKHAAELVKLESENKLTVSPKLTKFSSLEVEIRSPKKGSPVKVINSPVKKPAYQRYGSLVEPSASLPLPYSFEKLLELFDAVDKVCSIFMARKEMVTFRKLQPAVQEMTRKNLTERHLGQMAAFEPKFFNFRIDKLKNYGSTSKADRYELVIVPVVPSADSGRLLPSVMKARREAFYQCLLSKTKEHHKAFLLTLDPPVEVTEAEVKRWHPGFMAFSVPDIVPVELPRPPNSEKPASASDVLDRARRFMSSSTRLLTALEAAADQPPAAPAAPAVPTPEPSPAVKAAVESRLGDPLKGVSSSLLEKIRAKQAARALEAMRMTPQQEQEILMYTRLPDLARIVRTVFINEQKSVVSWEAMVAKVQFSYNRSIGRGVVDSHVRLLVQHLPEWLSIVHMRNADHLKMNRHASLDEVMARLKKLVDEKKRSLCI